jgi:hypothetical protein
MGSKISKKKSRDIHNDNDGYNEIKLAPPENLYNLTDKIQSLEHKLNNLLELQSSQSSSPHSTDTVIHSSPTSEQIKKPVKLPLRVNVSLFGNNSDSKKEYHIRDSKNGQIRITIERQKTSVKVDL